MAQTKQLIASASTVNQKNQAKAWEEVVEPCPHVFDLTQLDNPSLNLSQTKCDNCELNTNLWLCLTCGAIGCGRKQYDGSGGNNHGVDHFASTGHPISVKLGTITAEGEADTHCYQCDNMVQDPELVKHLTFHKVLVNEQVKTELSMTELQLELNSKFDFNMTSEDGKNYEPRFGPNLTGLRNLGNSCYMASVLQCLVALDSFAMPFVDPTRDHYLTCASQPYECVQCQLIKLVDGMISGQYSVPETSTDGLVSADPSQPTQSQRGIEPLSFKHLIGAKHPEFSTMRQQDAYEFLQFLQTTLSRTPNLPKVNSAFEFKIEHRLQCTGCQKVKYTQETIESLSVPLPQEVINGEVNETDLSKCLDYFFQPTTISGYNCSTCKTNTEVTNTTRILSFPEILILNVRQFTLKNWVPTKLEAKVHVPTEEVPLLTSYQAHQHPEGEILFEEEPEAASGPQIDPLAAEQIMGMGFSKNAAERAIVNTGNSGAETAMNWLFEHMEDPQLNEPLSKDTGSSNTNINEADIENLVMMGFTRDHSINALKATDSNLERAVEWIFSHPEGTVVEDNNQAQQSNSSVSVGFETPGDYRLVSFINHKGTSVHCGHYISHVKHNDEFIMFNDNKVVSNPNPPSEEAYVYLFKRVNN